MKDRTTLTKSLHTITVVSRIGAQNVKDGKAATAVTGCRDALALIGWPHDWSKSDDPVFAKCVEACKAILAGERK